jgi:uncharacterized protein (UPF0332 family)
MIGHFPETVSRAYYAMFYAARAAVLAKGIQVKRHQSVTASFGRIFARLVASHQIYITR